MTTKIEAPSYRTVPGVYWETPWIPPHNSPRGRTFRPCPGGLADFFELPPGVRFKVCFARCDGEPAPWATRRYHTRDYIHKCLSGNVYDLRVQDAVYAQALGVAGFCLADPIQWWVEYEELT